ncbi:MAG: fumarate hydratase, partial [Thermomicrobiales bacterium]
MPVREVDVADVRDTVEQLCLDANYDLPENVVQALAAAREREVSTVGKQTITILLENADIAQSGRM